MLMQFTKPKTSINPIKVKKEPGTNSLFPICTLEILVLHTKIRNKEPVPGSRFLVISFILIYAPSTLTSQYSLYADR